jgi:hypothetical protein
MGAWAADDMTLPWVGSWIAPGQWVLVPFYAIVRLPIRDEDIAIAIAIHIDNLRIATPIPHRSYNVFGPIGVLIPNQRPTSATRDDHLSDTISVNIPHSLNMRVHWAVSVNNNMLKLDSLIRTHF